MAFDKQTLAMSKKYVRDVVRGLTLIEGKPCTIDSIVEIAGGHRVNFKWTADDGTTKTDYMDVMDGVDGNPGAPGTDGSDGVSPTVVVKTSTDDTYILTITDKNGSYDTPNLKGSGGGGSASALDNLTDVDITNPASGDVLTYDGEKWINAQSIDPPTPSERTETITTYTAGKTLKFKDENHIPSEIMVADSAYTLGITDFITLENATKIVMSAYAVAAEWNLSYVFYNASKTPIYGGCPGNDNIPVDATNKFIRDHEITINPNAKYVRFVFWSNSIITWEHPYAKITYVEGDEPSGEIQTKRFNVTINKATVESGGYTSYSDYGILFLPSTYKNTGAKTRLVIACHGSGTVIDNNFTVDTKEYVKTLVHMGYAVMDVNGGVADGRHFGAQFAIQSYVKAYHYAISNYNLYPEVFVFGASMGGLCSFALVQNGYIPVIAQAAICPVTDLLRQAWMKPWWNDGGNYGRQRERIAEYYNFDNYASYTSGTAQIATAADMQYFVNNANKTMGYNPMVNKAVNGEDVITDATAGYAPLYSDLVKFHNAPLMVSHAENDDAVAYEFTTYIVDAIKRGGGEVYFKSYPTGGHSPNLGGTVTLTGVDGNTFTSYDSLSRVVSWFNRFK